MAAQGLHPAESRGYRELYALTQHLVSRWSRLARRLGRDDAALERGSSSDALTALERGADSGRRLLEEVAERTGQHGLHGTPAARGLGAWTATARSELGDRFLERNQALRQAVLDVHRLRIILQYLAALAGNRADQDLVRFCGAWERRLQRVEAPVRRAAVATAEDPDRAIAPLDASSAGRAAHGVAHAIGSLGERIDARAASRPGA